MLLSVLPGAMAERGRSGPSANRLQGFLPWGFRVLFAGQSTCETGHNSEALRYLRNEEELGGRLANRGDIYLAAGLVALGRVAEGKERLRSIYGQLVANGQGRSWFGKLSAFDAIRGDADMVELVDEWERAERVGAPA